MDGNTIGKKIFTARKILKLKQDEFGEQLGVAKQTVSSWEKGRTLPDIMMLAQIASMCGLSLNDFIDNPKITVQNGITEKELRIIQKLRTANTKTRQAIELLLDIKN